MCPGFLFVCLHLYCVWRSTFQNDEGKILFPRFNPPTFFAWTCISNSICWGLLFCIQCLRWEVIVRFVDICGIVAQDCLNFHLVISFIFSIYLLRIWICIWIMETRRILILKCHFQEAKFYDFGLHVWCNFTICILFTYTLINVLLCFMKVLSPNHFKRIPSSRPNISNPNSSKAPCTWKVENIIKL